ncbi:MAG: serine protease [Gammaproteobacteria bacterium]
MTSGTVLKEFRPQDAIVPIVRWSDSLPIKQLLGTGFFVGSGEKIHVVTAKHVFEGNPLLDGEKYAICLHGGKQIAVALILQVRASLDFDLAVCKIPHEQLSGVLALPIARSDAALTDDIFSYEYSQTRIVTTGRHTHVSFEPNAHKGNIVRSYESTWPEKIKTPSFLTSYPALQGASGAPVIAPTRGRKSFAVVGMLVANVEQHLLPAQVFELREGEKYHEKTSYFLPYGKAIARPVVVQSLEGMSVPFAFADEGDLSGTPT